MDWKQRRSRYWRPRARMLGWIRRALPPRRLAISPVAIAALVFAGTVFATVIGPANGTASGLAARIGNAVSRLRAASPAGQAFVGVPAVGALFPADSGPAGQHFCTASVVHSPDGDLAVTAAHCVSETALPITFIPGYHDGAAPYGTWQVTSVYTDQAWQSSADPDDDVAFLRLSPASDGVPIEDVTGSERLGTGWPGRSLVQVIGYPETASEPVWCVNWTHAFSAAQLEFDCGGYRDGTSGGPFLANVSRVSGQGTVIGVIGGFEQGGDTSEVSYSAFFGPSVAALYQAALAGG